MKILMVNKFLYAKGGAETYFLKVGRELENRGHEVQYFGMADPANTVFNRAGEYVSSKDFHKRSISSLLYPLSIVYSRQAKLKIKKVIADFHPDIVHMNNINYQLTPSVIEGAYEAGVPVVQTVHDTQMICPSHMMLNLNDYTLCEKCLNHNKLGCIKNRCVHGSLFKSIMGAVEGTLYAHRRSYQKVKLFICPSGFMETLLNRDKRLRGRTRMLHNFIELTEHKEYEKKGYVLYFGRLSVEKGIDRLMDACRMLPDIPFVVCGSGPEEEAMLLNLPKNVRFEGFQTGEALNKFIAQAAFSLYFPILYENCPMSVLESQSLGTPVLANRIGGIPELIDDGVTGRLLDDFSAESYAKAIREMYDDTARLEKMREACIEKRGELVSLTGYVNELLEMYKHCLAGI